MASFLRGLDPRWHAETRRWGREHGDVRFVWLAVPWDLAMWIWWRGLVNPTRRLIADAHYYRHRGDTTSQWWSPTVGEAVTDCFGRPATVVSVDLRGDTAVLDYGNREPGRARNHSWRNCVSPAQWAEPGPVHTLDHDGAPAFVARPIKETP